MKKATIPQQSPAELARAEHQQMIDAAAECIRSAIVRDGVQKQALRILAQSLSIFFADQQDQQRFQQCSAALKAIGVECKTNRRYNAEHGVHVLDYVVQSDGATGLGESLDEALVDYIKVLKKA